MPKVKIQVPLLLALLVTSAQAHALTKSDILFYAPFDGTATAARAIGDTTPVSVTKPVFTEGRTGQALLTGGADSEVTYASAKNLDLEAGSVAMWVKPADWSSDTFMRWFFKVGESGDAGGSGEGDFLWLYKYFQYSVFWLVQQDRPQRQVYHVAPASLDYGGPPPFDWKQGQWSHLIASWAGSQMNLYIDGKYIGTTYTPTRHVLRQFASTFQIGGKNTRDGGTMDTAIDDLLILRRPVTEVEAKAICETGMLAFEGGVAPRPTLQVQGGYMPSSDSVLLKSGLIGLRPDELTGLQLKYSISKSGENKPWLQGEAPFDHVQQITRIGTGKLPNGHYTLRAAVMGQISKTIGMPVSLPAGQCEFTKSPPAEWQGNKIGYITGVPAPWTPLVKQNDALLCWGRKYSLGKGVFPTQITALGQPMLNRPIVLHGMVDGKSYRLDKVRLKWEKLTPERIEWSAAASLGKLPVKIRGWMEYDGLIWWTISVGNSGSFQKHRLTDLEIEIPFVKSAATLMQNRALFPVSGKTTDFSTALLNTPSFWLGNDAAGLQWTTDSLSDWKLKDAGQMLKVQIGRAETVMRLKLIDHDTRPQGSLNYSLGLQATPVKPLDPRRHVWEMQFSGINASAARPAWVPYWQNWNRRSEMGRGPYGYQIPGPSTMADLKSFVAQNKSPFIYWYMHGTWPADPVLKIYGGEWGRQFDADADPFSSLNIDLSAPSLRDYMVWRNWKTLKDSPELARDSVGLYIDGAQSLPQLQRNDDGSYTTVFETLPTRELQKRNYFMLKEWPGKLIINHQSGNVSMEQLAFADMMLTGEHLADNAKLANDLNYHHVLNLDRMRAEFNAQQYGIPMVFLPEIGRVAEGNEERHKSATDERGIPAAEHLCGMLWSHDVIPYIAYVNEGVFKQAARAKDAFGWDADTEFIGYWQNANLVRSRSNESEVVTSIFKRKGRVLFVTMNDSDVDATVDLTPDWAALGLTAPATLVDAYAEQGEAGANSTVAVKNGKSTFTVKARNFRALVAR